mmetsp:Transcript_23006/g.55051  ORF Transcript_23006/g.55051 Transcript_23006/m.55051 type:complete len:225 (-) Transcript_23006:285-959(-)
MINVRGDGGPVPGHRDALVLDPVPHLAQVNEHLLGCRDAVVDVLGLAAEVCLPHPNNRRSRVLVDHLRDLRRGLERPQVVGSLARGGLVARAGPLEDRAQARADPARVAEGAEVDLLQLVVDEQAPAPLPHLLARVLGEGELHLLELTVADAGMMQRPRGHLELPPDVGLALDVDRQLLCDVGDDRETVPPGRAPDAVEEGLQHVDARAPEGVHREALHLEGAL